MNKVYTNKLLCLGASYDGNYAVLAQDCFHLMS